MLENWLIFFTLKEKFKRRKSRIALLFTLNLCYVPTMCWKY